MKYTIICVLAILFSSQLYSQGIEAEDSRGFVNILTGTGTTKGILNVVGYREEDRGYTTLSLPKTSVILGVSAGEGYGVTGVSKDVGVHGRSFDAGDGVSGESFNGNGIYGISSNGYGVYGESRLGNGSYFIGRKQTSFADIVLGAEGKTGTEDNGVIMSDPAYGGSDIFLISNDALIIKIDNNQDANEGGNFIIQDGAGTELFKVTESGTVSVQNSILQRSDRNSKELITDLNYSDILQAVMAMPIYEWQYKELDRRHIGPMAQDFHAAFGLGEDDITIASIDADGVALAAIKALHQQNNSQQSEIDALRQEIAELRILLTKQIKKVSED